LFHYYLLREELDGLREGRSERSRRESSDSRFSSDRDLGPVFLDQVSPRLVIRFRQDRKFFAGHGFGSGSHLFEHEAV
jgi:hypothetical protein